LKDPSLAGFEILGISVNVPTKEGCSCDPIASAWLTNKLQVAGEYNLPDLQQVNGLIKNYGTEEDPELRLDLTFPEPYKLTDEGVYIGYSLTVTSCNVPGSGWTAKYPIETVCDIDAPECFMIHCTKGSSTLPQKYPEWTDMGQTTHQALAMKVMMRGTTRDNAAGLVPLQVLYASPGSTGKVYTRLNNYGTNPINSIEYSYALDLESDEPQTFTEKIVLDTPVNGQMGASAMLDLSFNVPEAVGQHEISVRVDKVNDVPNEYTGSTKIKVDVVPFLPVNRPLIEDYTGMWCKYCPMVYVILKQMQDKYGDALLSLAYHCDDQIQGVKAAELPSSSYGLPKVYIGNRKEEIEANNVESQWLFKRRELAPADISVVLSWADEAHSKLKAESTVRFIYDEMNADYKLAYALVEDDMSDPAWRQDNAYNNSDFTGPYWDLFCGKGSWIKGLIYDDVVVSFPYTRGIDGSVPSEIEGGVEYKHSGMLDLKDAVCQYVASPHYNANIIKNPDKLRVVALLIDGKSGNVCNAASTRYSGQAPTIVDPAGVEFPLAEDAGADIVSTEYYTLDGIGLKVLPDNGVFIKIDRMV
ncbi:MAG: hypothetical protein K2L89_03500, partial [Muribaculaceae bacterium]|nr:hypothetical protein [Muribaculaceae bacterium]